MSGPRPLRAILVASVLSFAAGAGVMRAQQQATTRREPQFENDEMKVWKSIIMPNQPLTQHRHEHGRALVALTDGTLDVVNPAGKVVNTYHGRRAGRTGLVPIRRVRLMRT